MSVEALPYDDAWRLAWDEFCATAVNATFLHTRNFLSYHGNRFTDASVLFLHDDRIVGVLPAARSNEDPFVVVSHPGATYGGVVHHGWMLGERMIEAMQTVKQLYSSNDYDRFLYKPLPYIYGKTPSQDDLYALFRLDARLVRSDLSSAIDLANRRPVSERRRRGLKKASKVAAVTRDKTLLPDLWAVIERNLATQHGARPVHALEEIADLVERFPDSIEIVTGRIEGRVEAGVVLFNTPQVCHAQYIASTDKGYDFSVLDAVFESVITQARLSGVRYFDFGTSNEDKGRILNDGLYRFKSEFGGGGVVHSFYEVDLRS